MAKMFIDYNVTVKMSQVNVYGAFSLQPVML